MVGWWRGGRKSRVAPIRTDFVLPHLWVAREVLACDVAHLCLDLATGDDAADVAMAVVALATARAVEVTG